MRKSLGGIATAVIIALVVIVLFVCTVRIPAGYVGVVYNMNGGISDRTLTQGFHVISPTQNVTTYSIGIEQSYLTASKDGDSNDDESFEVPSNDGKGLTVDMTFTYSFSKLGTINSCLFSAWRTYILHDRGSGSVYTELGTASHQAIEDFIEGKIDKSGMLPIFESGVEQCEMLGFDFPKDFKGGNSIRNRYLADLKNCFQTFTMPKGKFTIEELLILRVSPTRAMQGYSDLLRWNNDGSVTVLDLKTSSDYAQKDLLDHGRQLTIYGMALEQAGYKVKSTAWIMLKYVVIKYDWYATRRSKNKTPLTRIVNRSKIYDTIKDAVEAACHEAGMDEMDIEIAMMDFAKTNILGNLFPAEVKAKFSIKPYVREYPYTKELQAEALDYINKTADLYESLPQDKDHPWEPCEITKENQFFCNTLCNHRKSCPYIKDYNERTMAGATQSKKDEEDLF